MRTIRGVPRWACGPSVSGGGCFAASATPWAPEGGGAPAGNPFQMVVGP